MAGKDLFMRTLGGVSHYLGTSYEKYMTYIKEAKEEALSNMIRQAVKADANAIMGLKIEYTSIGSGGMMISVSGTAVVIPSGL
jgi:Uncharacterized conserved protein